MAERLASTAGIPTEWIDCSATAYVNDPATELPIEHGIRSDLPQFTSPRLDSSFMTDLYTILLGRTKMEIARDRQRGRPHMPLRRVAGAVPSPQEHSITLYVCSDELCGLIAALDERRAADIAGRWYALLMPSVSPTVPAFGPSCQLRARVIPQLAALARDANSTGRKLMIRVEYRRHTLDAEGQRLPGKEDASH